MSASSVTKLCITLVVANQKKWTSLETFINQRVQHATTFASAAAFNKSK